MNGDIMFWVLLIGAVVAAFSIIIVALMMLFIRPALDSPARYFIEAKRKRKAVCILDDGSKWIFSVGDLGEEGIIRDDLGNVITVTPNSMKYARGVLMGVGENFRSMLVNPAIIEIIGKLNEKKISPEEVRALIGKIEKEEKPKEDKNASQGKTQEEETAQ